MQKVLTQSKISRSNFKVKLLFSELLFTRLCFESNENPGLTVFHTLFLREHNRIAAEVQRLRPNWNEEKIYQETRKIVIASVQNIVYGEFLPLVLGKNGMRKYGLNLSDRPVRDLYDKGIRPMIRNSFATAAYRFGHSLVTSTIKLDFDDGTTEDFKLEDKLLNTKDLYDTRIFKAMTKGMTTHALMKFDMFMTSSLSRHLFKSLDAKFGRDLASINIQRGRDHGLPSYNKFREFCGLRRLSSFRSLRGGNLQRAEGIYRLVDSNLSPM
ncbi:Chorion peroxidase [Nymphon striatum]|nr:Chorion peroxidase [Nymphon striatum]